MLSTAGVVQSLQKLNSATGGVYATADLAVLLGRDGSVQLAKVIRRLTRDGVLLRVRRGLYADGVNGFRPEIVGQRWVAPSYLSTETALDWHGLCQTGIVVYTYVTPKLIPSRKSATRRFEGHEFVYRHIAAQLFFGYEAKDGLLMAQPTKAVLDFLYFVYKGQQSVLAPQDIAFARVNPAQYRRHLQAYRQRGFKNFALGFLEKRRSKR